MHYRYYLFIAAIAFFAVLPGSLNAQVLHSGEATFFYFHKNNAIPLSLEYSLSHEQKQERYQALTTHTSGIPVHAGFSLGAGINPLHQGYWQTLGDTMFVWTIRIQTPEALGTGLVFENFNLSPRARIFLYTPDQEHVIGAYTSFNNRASQTMSTHILPGSELIIEYQERIEHQTHPMMDSHFEISEVIHLFTGLDNFLYDKNVPSSQPCHVNINCPEGDDWQVQKRGVAKMVMRQGSGWFLCSGSLINTTANDGTPYFLTADHCASEASEADYNVWQFYFNYERPDCSNTGTVPTNMVTGAVKLATGPIQGGTDFKLLLLNTDPLPSEWNLYYNGWSISTASSPNGVSIHHPAGDAKKISTYITSLQNSTWPGAQGAPPGLSNGAWRVRWAATQTNHSVVQGGSSGSPIFNSEGLIVGTLTGGSSNCDNPNNFDYYGKMDKHWTANGASNDKQLAPWLNPTNLNITFMNGFDPLTFNPYPAPLNIIALKQGQNVVITWQNPVAHISTAPPIQKYTIYRNGVILHEHTDLQNLTFTDPEPGLGFFTYYLTTTYLPEDQEAVTSNASEVFGVLFPENCELVLNDFPYQQTFMENEVPECWLVESQNASTWQIVSDYSPNAQVQIQPVSGDHFLMVTPSSEHKEEWFISPQIDFTNLNNPRLRFSFAGNYELSPLEVTYELGLYISINESVFEPVWFHYSEPSIYTVDNFSWVTKGVNLNQYQGQDNVRIAFRFHSDQPEWIALDQIILQHSNEVTAVVNPANSGLVRGLGFYSPQEEVTLQTIPNDGFGFVHWKQGEEIVGDQLNYSFAMPDNNISFTAVFASAFKLEVEVFPAGAGSITGEGFYLGGQVANLIATANPGYRFVNWNYFGNILSTSPSFAYTMPNANRKLQAFFEEGVNVENFEPTQKQIVISPNPSSGYFNLHLTNALTQGSAPLSLEIIDLQGRTKHSQQLPMDTSSNAVTVNVQHLPTGLYLIRVHNGNEAFTQKLMIQ
ncbi:MAG: InlB B-repeat-containing protein [Bacteroidales bacterium]